MTDNPFIPGARVAIEDRWSRDKYTEAFVDRVYKTGNFTLRGSSKQWRPWEGGMSGYWTARTTGNDTFSNRGHLRIWDDTTDAEISNAIAIQNRMARIRKIINRLSLKINQENITDEQISAIEAALPKLPEKTA